MWKYQKESSMGMVLTNWANGNDMKFLTPQQHLQKALKYDYFGDYIEELDILDIEKFLLDCGNPHKNEQDIFLRMFWVLDAMYMGVQEDMYFKSIFHE